MLSFTKSINYKIAYMELIGAAIGSFIAIYGALWVQRKTNEKAEANKRKKYARIAYYDLNFAFKDLIKIYEDAKRQYYIDSINESETVDKFCNIVLGRKLHLNPTWISDVAQLGEDLSVA